jgi:hypothetical protein
MVNPRTKNDTFYSNEYPYMPSKRTANRTVIIRIPLLALILLLATQLVWCADEAETRHRASIITYPLNDQPDSDLERIFIDTLTLELATAEFSVAGVVLDARKNLFLPDARPIPEVEWCDILLATEYLLSEGQIEIHLLIIDPLQGQVLAEVVRSVAVTLSLDRDVLAILRETISLLDQDIEAIALEVRERRAELVRVDEEPDNASTDAIQTVEETPDVAEGDSPPRNGGQTSELVDEPPRQPAGAEEETEVLDVAGGSVVEADPGDAQTVIDSFPQTGAAITEVYTAEFELNVGLSPHIVMDGGERELGRGLSGDVVLKYALQQQRYQWIFGAHTGLSWLRSWEDSAPVEGYVFPLMILSGVGTRGPGVFQFSFTVAAGPAIGLYNDQLSGMQMRIAIAGRAGVGMEIHLVSDFRAEVRAAAYVLQEGAGTNWGFMPSLLFAFSPMDIYRRR